MVLRIIDRARWAAAVFISMLVLSAPALWNRFPLLQYDTGGYLARWYEGYLVPSRAAAYGLMLNAGSFWNFWPVVLLQCALTVWLLALTLRVFGLGRRPWLLTGIIILVSVATTLPWLTAILLTDIFCGLGIVALALLLLDIDAITRAERIGLVALAAFSAATHSATLAVQVAVLAGAPFLWWTGCHVPWLCWRHGALALVLGVALTFTANFAVSGRLAWTPGGFALSFGRMLQDGIVDKYLGDHCPDPKLRLCAYRAELPRDADEFFWGNPIFIKLGRFAGLGTEMERIAIESIVDYPALQLKTAAVAMLRQLVDVRTGEGVVNSIWHTYAIVKERTPWIVPAMQQARQQNGAIDFGPINDLHWPLALLAMMSLPFLVLGARWGVPPPLRYFAAVTVIALLANAAVCGILSNPHDRYGARLAWIPLFVAALGAYGRERSRDSVAQGAAFPELVEQPGASPPL